LRVRIHTRKLRLKALRRSASFKIATMNTMKRVTRKPPATKRRPQPARMMMLWPNIDHLYNHTIHQWRYRQNDQIMTDAKVAEMKDHQCFKNFHSTGCLNLWPQVHKLRLYLKICASVKSCFRPALSSSCSWRSKPTRLSAVAVEICASQTAANGITKGAVPRARGAGEANCLKDRSRTEYRLYS
jgi:hypothetical protein